MGGKISFQIDLVSLNNDHYLKTEFMVTILETLIEKKRGNIRTIESEELEHAITVLDALSSERDEIIKVLKSDHSDEDKMKRLKLIIR